MQKMLENFKQNQLSRDQMKSIQGGKIFDCTMSFTTGGVTYTKEATIRSGTQAGAESYNSMCEIGPGCSTSCTEQ